MLLFSCTVETSGNGDLDGYWHLLRVDTIATGGVRDLGDSLVFWGVEHKLIGMRGHGGYYYLSFEQTDDSLVIHSPYINYYSDNPGQGDDYPLADVRMLWQFGIEDLEVHYKKEGLSGSRMVLRSGRLRLYFKKF